MSQITNQVTNLNDIQQNQGIFSADEPPLLNPEGYLTPDALMVYCETRMSGIDQQMQNIFAQQTASNAQIQALNTLEAALNQDPNGVGNGNGVTGNTSPDAFSKLETAYDTAIAAVGGANTAVGQQLAADKQNLLEAGSDQLVSPTEITSMINNVKTYESNLNSGSELAMIQLQSLMSQRQTAIQLTTNLVQALGDQANKIADNVGK